MAISWDYADTPRLVRQLSPPASPQAAERALRRIYNGFARELYRERWESQPTKQVRKELEALQKALSGLSPRTATVLRGELEKGPFLPYPYHQAQLVINPCMSGVPWTHLPGAVLLRTMSRATDHALEDPPRLRSGHPGKVSDATRRAIHVLCLVYCRCHHAPYPTWDFYAEEVRNPAALDFAFICLRAWWTPGIEGLEPKDVTRSLHNVNSLILTPAAELAEQIHTDVSAETVIPGRAKSGLRIERAIDLTDAGEFGATIRTTITSTGGASAPPHSYSGRKQTG